MLTRLPAILMIALPVSLTPVVALAASCGDYPLTAKQLSYLDSQTLEIVIPDGQVPVIKRCDVDGNDIIDSNDLMMIRDHRGEPAAHPDDPMDWDGNGTIHGRDVGGCASSCTSNGCAVKEQAEEDGLQAALEIGDEAISGDPAACYQADDFDGDGVEDFMGIFEYAGSGTRGGEWTLQVVILTEDSDGNVQHITFPYTGQLSSTTNQLAQHLSVQSAGVVDLMPGSVTIASPGVVSYRNGEPKVLYYYENGVLTLAAYGIVD